MSKSNFVKGAAILGLAGIVIKIIGAAFRIPLASIIGSEGMGYYSSAYPIYVFLLIIATSGFPTAISKLVSEKRALQDYRGAHRIFRISLLILMVIGGVTSAVVFFGADWIAFRINNPLAAYSLMALAPALVFTAFMSAFRGYFQGRNNMVPTAVSQIVEQFFRVALGLGLAIWLTKKGLEYGAAGASFGASAGAIASSLAIVLIYFLNKPKIDREVRESKSFPVESTGRIVRRLLMIAVPIIIGSGAMPLMGLIDVAIVQGTLQNQLGYSAKEATALYGQLTGMAATLINLPQILTQSLAMSIVPVISEAMALGDVKKAQHNAKLAIRIALLLGLPAGVGMLVLATPIMQTLYPKEPAAIGQLLMLMALGVPFLSIVQTCTGILQGMEKPYIPVINLFIALAAKLACTVFLTPIPSLNVKGAAIGTVLAYIIAAGLDFYWVKRLFKLKFNYRQYFGRPIFVSALMGLAAFGLYQLFMLPLRAMTPMMALRLSGASRSVEQAEIFWFKIANAGSTLTAIFIAILFYGWALLYFKAITREELEAMPKGKRLSARLYGS